MAKSLVLGQPSYRVAADRTEAFVTELGAHVGPVRFLLGDRAVEPLSVAPWHQEDLSDQPPVIQVLRGDFFCMPFGAADEPFRGKEFPPHGDPANEPWSLIKETENRLELACHCPTLGAEVKKTVETRPGETALYQSHDVSGVAGPMSFGMHAMVRFPAEGLISTSKIKGGQVLPGAFEDPAKGGYSILEPGARFDRLSEVPRKDGGTADLSKYPAREGFEDLIQIFADDSQDLAWSCVVFPSLGYGWIQLKNPQVLTGTVLWHSNGGRHYHPWNGRHRSVLGLEEVTAYFHLGLTEEHLRNNGANFGVRTFRECRKDISFSVKTVQAVFEVEMGFDRVVSVEPKGSKLRLMSDSGQSTHIEVDYKFLQD